MRKELRGFTLIYISTKPSKRYVLRKRRKFRANYDDDSGNFNVDHLVKRGGEVAHVNAEGNETASSGTKICLYLVKGMLIFFKILRFGEVGVFFDRAPLYKLKQYFIISFGAKI